MTTLRMQVSANSLIERTELFFEKLALVIEHVDSTRLPMADFDENVKPLRSQPGIWIRHGLDRLPACVRCMLLAATTSCSL